MPIAIKTGQAPPSPGGWVLRNEVDLTVVENASYFYNDIISTTVVNNGIEIGGQVIQYDVGLEARAGEGLFVLDTRLGIFSVGPSIDLSIAPMWAIVADMVGGDAAARGIGIGFCTGAGTGNRNTEEGSFRFTRGSSNYAVGESFIGGRYRSAEADNSIPGKIEHICAIFTGAAVLGFISIEGDGLVEPAPDEFLAERAGNGHGRTNFGTFDLTSGSAFPVIVATANSGVYGFSKFRIYSIG